MVANYFLYQNSIVYLLRRAQQQAEAGKLQMAERFLYWSARWQLK